MKIGRVRPALALLAACLMAAPVLSGRVRAETMIPVLGRGRGESLPVEAPQGEGAQPGQPSSAEAGSYTAKAALLMELSTGKVLFEQNPHQRLAPASLTKLMGLILVLEEMEAGRLGLEDRLVCSEYAKSMGGSEIWLKAGEEMTVDDLLKAVFVASANDAMVVLAEAVAVTEETFVERMNRKAQEMGLENTHFVNCTGFDEEGHYTSARDVAVMARELTRYSLTPQYSTIWMDTLRGGETQLVNTNRLVRFYQGATGLKTGTTDNAGHCLCATATRGGLSLVSVVLGCGTGEVRFEESRQLLDYGFTHYTLYQPQPVDQELVPMKVTRGVEDWVALTCNLSQGQVVRQDDLPSLQQSLELPQWVEAPVEPGQEIGRLVVTLEGQEVASYPVRARDGVERMGFGNGLERLAQELLAVV